MYSRLLSVLVLVGLLAGALRPAFAQGQNVAQATAGVCSSSMEVQADPIVTLVINGRPYHVVTTQKRQFHAAVDWSGQNVILWIHNPGPTPRELHEESAIVLQQGSVDIEWVVDFQNGTVQRLPLTIPPCVNTPTPTVTNSPTNTPTATPTETDTPATTVPPTNTGTTVPPSATPTVTQTATQTTEETLTPTNTPVPPTTGTVEVPPTATSTVTPTVTETATQTTIIETPTTTNTPVPSTGTVVNPPTATKTSTPTATMPSTTIKTPPPGTNTPGPRPTQPSNPDDRTFQIFLCGPAGKVAVLDYTRNGVRRLEIVPLSADRTVGFAGISENQPFDISLNDREGNVLTSMNVPGLLSGPNLRNEWSPSGIAAHFREINSLQYADLIKAGEEWEPKYCSPEIEVPPTATPEEPEASATPTKVVVRSSPTPTATVFVPAGLPTTGGGGMTEQAETVAEKNHNLALLALIFVIIALAFTVPGLKTRI